MRLLAGFALALLTIACVQSNPINSRASVNDLLALADQLQLNSVDAIVAAFPQYAGLVNEITHIATQVANTLTPQQLYILEQQALGHAQNVLSGNEDVNAAATQILQQLQEYLGSDSQLLSNVQPVVQQLVGVVQTFLPLLSSNLRHRREAGSRTSVNDLLALADELQLNSVDAIVAAFPQYAGLVNEITNIATQVANTLSPQQLYILEQQALGHAQNVLSGNGDVNTAANQLLQQLQEYLGPDSQLLSNVQPVVQELVGVVQTFLPLLSSNL